MANPNPSPSTRVSVGNPLCDPELKLSPLAQLKRMQRVMFQMTQEPGVDKREVAQLACAWEKLEGRKATLCMRPAPKPIDVSDRAKRKRAPKTVLAPLQATPAPQVQVPSTPTAPTMPDAPAS